MRFLALTRIIARNALMVKWISLLTSDQSFWVRILVGAQNRIRKASLMTGFSYSKQTALLADDFVKRSHVLCAFSSAKYRRAGTAGT